jgi:hypothetical protein
MRRNEDEMDNQKLADLLFPEVVNTPEYYEEKFPYRKLPNKAEVTRMAPSPTGFIHLGNLYSALADERIAHRNGGVFYLRIEDTDEKRKVDGAVETIINVLRYFDIEFDEGAGFDVTDVLATLIINCSISLFIFCNCTSYTSLLTVSPFSSI